MYRVQPAVNYSDLIDPKLSTLNTQDYFKHYKQRMDSLQKEKVAYCKEEKFYNYLNRLVDAKQIKEKERFNGSQVLNDFIHDSKSLVNHKKMKLKEEQYGNQNMSTQNKKYQQSREYMDEKDMTIEELYKLKYAKSPLCLQTYDPQFEQNLLEKNYVMRNERNMKVNRSIKEERPTKAGINLLKKFELQKKANNNNLSMTLDKGRNSFDKPYSHSVLLNHKDQQDLSLDQTLQPSDRNTLVKPDNPVFKARIPTLFGQSRNSPKADTSVFQARAYSMNNADQFHNSNLIDENESSKVLIDLKKRELVNLKKSNYYNNNIYELNVNTISRVKYDKNKNILEPKIEQNYSHSTVKPRRENELETSILDTIAKADHSYLNQKTKNTTFKYQIKHSNGGSPSKIQDEDPRSNSKLNLIMKLQKDLNSRNNNNRSQSNSVYSSFQNLRSQNTLKKAKQKQQQDSHIIVFIEDGQCLSTCKSIKLDLNFYKQKYYIEPPKYISKLPKEYKEVQSRFDKRAYKELLEICSSELTDKTKNFVIMYALDGELIESIDDVEDDCNVIIVSENKDSFKGLVNPKDTYNVRDMRIDNAKDLKKQYQEMNNKFTNQSYLEWIERVGDKFATQNLEKAVANHYNNDYLMNNSQYKRKNNKRLGDQQSLSPTFQGGGFKNCNEFLLPEIEKGIIQDELRKLRSNRQAQVADIEKLKSNKINDDFLESLKKFKDRNQLKDKLHVQSQKPNTNLDSKINQTGYNNGSSALENNTQRQLQTQIVNKEAKLKNHSKTVSKQVNKASFREPTQKKTLAYEECKLLSDEYLLSCQVIYELHSEFTSLIHMGEKKQTKTLTTQNGVDHNNDTDEQDNDDEEGVLLDIFKESCTILKEKHDEIIERIFLSLGVSIHARHAKINWSTFLSFYSILKYFTATQSSFLKFWMKVFNPSGQKTVPKEEFIDTLEKLARGAFTNNTTLISQKFSSGFYKMLVDKKCVREENGDVIIDKMVRKIKKNEIDIEYLNQTLKPDSEYILEDDDINFNK